MPPLRSPPLDNKARTELEASVEKKTAEMAAWKKKQSQSAEWQYANCWTSVYAKLFDRLTPEEVLTVGGACDEGVYTVEMADSTGPGQCEPGTYYVEGGGGAGCTAQAGDGWSQSDEVPGWQDFSDEIDWQTDVVGHIADYTDITEEVVSQLEMVEGESCSGSALCAGFKGAYYDEFSAHACEAMGMSANERALTMNNMVQTVQMARPLDIDLLADEAMRPFGAWAECHNALAEAHCNMVGDCNVCGHEVNALGDDSFRPFRTHKTGEWSEMGQIVGDWFQTADDCRLSDVSDITRVPEHDLIRLNQDRGFANFPKPRDGPLTASGGKRSYCGQVGRFQADTWLRLKEGAVFEKDIKERSSTVGNSEAAVVPKVITRPVVELSEVQKLTRDDYLGADEAKLKALRAASQEADEKWVIAQKGNEPVAETLPFMRAADSAKQELEKATQRAAEQKETDESARIPSYAGMYRRAEGSSKCAAPRVNAPEFRIRNDLLEKRDRVGHDWRIVLPTEKAQHDVLHSAHHALGGHASHNTMLRDISRRYWWHGMRDACTEFVNNCEHCQRFKSRTQRSFGTMAEVEEPESMGIAYSIDFNVTNSAPKGCTGLSS